MLQKRCSDLDIPGCHRSSDGGMKIMHLIHLLEPKHSWLFQILCQILCWNREGLISGPGLG